MDINNTVQYLSKTFPGKTKELYESIINFAADIKDPAEQKNTLTRLLAPLGLSDFELNAICNTEMSIEDCSRCNVASVYGEDVIGIIDAANAVIYNDTFTDDNIRLGIDVGLENNVRFPIIIPTQYVYDLSSFTASVKNYAENSFSRDKAMQWLINADNSHGTETELIRTAEQRLSKIYDFLNNIITLNPNYKRVGLPMENTSKGEKTMEETRNITVEYEGKTYLVPGCDKFYVNEENQSVTQIYYNPDSSAGGQFVNNYYTFDDILDAMQTSDPMDYLQERCKQTCADIDCECFKGDLQEFLENNEDFRSTDPDCLDKLFKLTEQIQNYRLTREIKPIVPAELAERIEQFLFERGEETDFPNGKQLPFLPNNDAKDDVVNGVTAKEIYRDVVYNKIASMVDPKQNKTELSQNVNTLVEYFDNVRVNLDTFDAQNGQAAAITSLLRQYLKQGLEKEAQKLPDRQ